MRRAGSFLVIVLLLAGAAAGGYFYGNGKGMTAGKATAAADRSAFQAARGTGVPAGGFGGQGGQGGQGAPGGATGGSPGAGAGRSGGGGTAVAGGSAVAGAPGGPGGQGGRAQGGQGGGTGVQGKVTKVDGSTLTLQGQDGAAVTVTAAGDTAITKLAAGAFADLKVDDIVAVQGDKTGDTYMARTITATGLPATALNGGGRGQGGAAIPGGAGGAQNALFGRIATIAMNTLSLQMADGMTVTVSTAASTTVRKQQTGALGDIKVGDTLTVVGEKMGDNAYTARLITDQGATP